MSEFGGLLLSLVLVAFLLAAVVRFIRVFKLNRVIVYQYQSGILFHKGVLKCVLPSGQYWTNSARTITILDLRRQTLNVGFQEVLTTDGLSLKITLTGEYVIGDPERFVLVSTAPESVLYHQAQQALREAVASLSFDTIVATRASINAQMLDLLTPQASALGYTLQKIEVRDIILPGELKRALAAAVSAQKEGAANLERARAESATLRTLANAARLMQDHPGLLQLRALQAIEGSKGNTFTIELPQSRGV